MTIRCVITEPIVYFFIVKINLFCKREIEKREKKKRDWEREEQNKN